MRTRIALVAVLTVLAVAGCSGDTTPLPPKPGQPSTAPAAPGAPADESCQPTKSLKPVGPLPAPGHMPAGSYMAEIQKRGRLVLGTSQDTLLFSSYNPFTKTVEGFDVDMARQISKAIFGRPDRVYIKVIAYSDRVKQASGVDPKNEVDLVADTMTINCARWKDVDFTTVYYDAGQKVLVSKASKAKSIQDLNGQKVCAATGSTSYDNISTANPKAVAVRMPAFGDCLVAFQRGQVDAVSTDDVILVGLAAQDPYAKVIGDRFTDEPYGMAISKDHPEFTRFVNAVLAKVRADGTWTKTYTKWLGKFGPAPAPPVAEYK
jgi:polar amino acid transport system substrate-binding protein